MKEIRQKLAEEDEQDLSCNTPVLLNISLNEFLVVGMDLEEEQYVIQVCQFA